MIKKNLTQKQLDNICYYMDDEIREQVHFELAPCSPYKFLKRYIELDNSILEIIESEFNYILEE